MEREFLPPTAGGGQGVRANTGCALGDGWQGGDIANGWWGRGKAFVSYS